MCSWLHPDEFIRYLATAKNMRCIIYGLDEEQIKLIRKYHRNRGVGVPSTILLPQGKCFTHVHLPNFLYEVYKPKNDVELVILLSSVYLAPIVTSQDRLGEFSSYAVKEIKASKYDVREFLRHLRISEYAIIDYYLSNHKNDVVKFANMDIKRFWRILDEEGTLVGYYLSSYPRIISIVLSLP